MLFPESDHGREHGGGTAGGGSSAGLNPNSYFGPGGRFNMRRKSDCGSGRGGGMQIPDPSHFQKMRRNRSLDKTNDDDDDDDLGSGEDFGCAPPGLLAFQMMQQQRARGTVPYPTVPRTCSGSHTWTQCIEAECHLLFAHLILAPQVITPNSLVIASACFDAWTTPLLRSCHEG